MKLLVSTTASFQLCGPGPEQFARHNRPSVVRPSYFINTAVSKGHLKVHGQLTDDAHDDSFVALHGAKDAVEATVIAGYLKDFSPTDAPAPAKTTAKSKAAS